MKLKTFIGFRGMAAHLEIDGISFFIVAPNADDLKKLYDYILPEPEEPFSEDHCQKSIVISDKLFPEKVLKSKIKTQIIDLPSNEKSGT